MERDVPEPLPKRTPTDAGVAGRCDSTDCCSPRGVDRRSFVQLIAAGAGLAACHTAGGVVAGPFDAGEAIDHYVPTDKKLADQWVRALFARGERTWYAGGDLATVGMPAGGICAGQVYLAGDGRLVYWDVFNSNHNTGFGAINYQAGRKPVDVVSDGKFIPATGVDQGAAVRTTVGDQTIVRTLDVHGFQDVRFCGEYPIGRVEYADESTPVSVALEAFSPFIPLNAADSALPATVLTYTVRNKGSAEAEVSLAVWLQNGVLNALPRELAGKAARRNRAVRGGGLTAIVGDARLVEGEQRSSRAPVVFADFESQDYGAWKAEGDAFGAGPARGTLPHQQHVSGFGGERLVNSFQGGDEPQGKLISPEFVVERPWISFLIGGGSDAEKTCINLVVDGEVVRSASGASAEQLKPHNWHVADLAGKKGRLEIIDAASEPWGHTNVDQIEFRDEPMPEAMPLRRRPDFGTMAVAVLGAEGTFAIPAIAAGGDARAVFAAGDRGGDEAVEKPLDEALRGAVGKRFTLPPGGEAAVTFVVAWRLPHNYRDDRWVGNYYAKRFRNAEEVVRYVANNFERLSGETHAWLEAYYDSTLPRWLLDRIGATVCNLATATCQWWRNGRFWAWEGVGCCHGTCGHVWNYAHAMARLFPELERSVRTMQDFAPGVGFDAETGAIGFRGEGWTLWAGDAQGGYILKAYREHQASADDEFLNANWRNIRRAVEFLIGQDGNGDGLIEGRQHQTYDQDYYGANTFVGSLYLGALRAAEEMAREVGEVQFANRCREVFEAGRENSVKRLFNGEYYEQDVDLEKHAEWQYAEGCLADQMFGQGWAHQVGLGYLYPRETVLKSLASVWTYCWTPDVAAQNKRHAPERWFAVPGEAGLFTCTWPKGKHLGEKSTRYRDEVWTGIEYQVANHMAWEGMLTEALAICRAVHERYHPSKRNPFNEIECGDHYARAMASWGMITSLAGFEYHGPRGEIGFAPRLQPEDFRAVFTAAEGWGSYGQKITKDALSAQVAVKWGRLRVGVLRLEAPEGAKPRAATAQAEGREIPLRLEVDGRRVELHFDSTATIEAGGELAVRVQLG
ncbi:MAG: hypothetical protein IT424_13520 [Pirellulales bacterium]|nr:hypothetical protein [Pirellulales bacterium]